jgi:hypothetical protein
MNLLDISMSDVIENIWGALPKWNKRYVWDVMLINTTPSSKSLIRAQIDQLQDDHMKPYRKAMDDG